MSDARSTSPVPVLELEHVAIPDREHASVKKLDDINLSIAAGDFLVVGGPPGSGKSGFLSTAACLSRPMSGTVRLFGKPVDEMFNTEGNRRRVGFVFDEGTRLFHHLTVEENIALPVRYHFNLGEAEARYLIEPWMKRFELEGMADKYPGSLARAWRARVALARAVVLKPELLVMDNPLAGLDRRQIQWWLDFVTALATGREPGFETPVTLLIAADHLAPWKDRARRFAVLAESRLVSLDGPEMPDKSKSLLNELFGEK